MVFAAQAGQTVSPVDQGIVKTQDHSNESDCLPACAVESGPSPFSLPADTWAGIKAQLRKDRYRAHARDDGSFVSSNPAHGWRINYEKDGTTMLRPAGQEHEPYYIAFRLNSVGYGNGEAVQFPLRISNDDERLSYHWSDNVTEYWINSEEMLEQWFQIQQRPEKGGPGGPLEVSMQLETDLNASLVDDDITLSRGTHTRITYNKLVAWDSTGRELAASMQLQGSSLSLLIDDEAAIYPLTIDPGISQEAFVKASNTDDYDQFGVSVAMSGNTLVVGAYDEASNATGVDGDQSDNSLDGAGAVYVYVRNGDTWSQQAYIKASNPDVDDHFGQSVAISGDTLVVGAFGEDSKATGIGGNQDDDTVGSAGAVYVFTRSGTDWSQQAYIKASNTAEFQRFGTSLAISGETLAVGAPGDSLNTGAVYVFTRNVTTWSQQAVIKASNAEERDFFGNAVALFGDTLAVGATGEDSNATGVGGDQSNNSQGTTNAGAVYVFTRSNNAWSQKAYIKASNTGYNDEFGVSIAISADFLVIGASGEDSNGKGIDGSQNTKTSGGSGAVYVFQGSGASWSQVTYIKASNADESDNFGNALALSGNRLLVGARLEDSKATGQDGNQNSNLLNHNAGAAYVFVHDGESWSQQSYLKASNTYREAFFAGAVTISGDYLAVGATRDNSAATGINGDESYKPAGYRSGAAYAFIAKDADLSITKTDGQDELLPGEAITYVITVTNNGPDNVVGARVEDSLPAELGNASWKCIPAAGASCTAQGVGDISDTVDLEAGASLVYELTASTAPDFAGTISTTASVTAPAAVYDADQNNNSSTDISGVTLIFENSFE
jgi:uncharacterized repeat protein (TIGR01451 family)